MWNTSVKIEYIAGLIVDALENILLIERMHSFVL